MVPVPIPALWAPILLSAVLVFVASFLVHMVLGYHKGDFKKLPNEDAVMDALRPMNIPPGDYMVPCPGGASDMKNPAFIEKRTRGPVALMTFMKPGPPTMGAELGQWFVYTVIVGVLAAYVAGRALPRGTAYLEVFRFAGTTAFIAYGVALWQTSIWYKKPWGNTLRHNVDALIYAGLTGGAFGWLWPR
jgi:hypothetical protein